MKLGEVANVYYGKGLPQNQRRANGQYWAYGSNGPIYKTDFYLIEPPTIIMGRKGSIGAVTLVLDKCWPIDTTYYFKIKEKATNINYLYWYLKTIDFSKIAITTTKPGLNRDDLNSTKIPLPPLPEQKHIVARIEALFSKIDEIKRLRKEANDLAKPLLQSALHEVFSKADEKGWRWVRLGEVVQLINGKAFRPSEWSDTGLPIIRIQNLNDPNKPFNYCNFKVPRKYIIDNGDILLSWSGTPGTSFGAHKWNRGKGVLNQHIFKVIFKKEWEVNKDYFVYSVNHKLNELIQKAHGGVGLQHVTKKKIQELQIPLPSLPEQKRIIAYLDSIQQKAQALQKLQIETEKEIEKNLPHKN